MKTTSPGVKQIQRDWRLVDAEGQILGRMASRIAMLLQGKHKPTYTPHLDTGDFVVVINAERVKVTGNKLAQKTYKRYSGYPSGLKAVMLADMLRTHPERVIQQAVKGMLPDGPRGRRLFGKLKVYVGAQHPHQAQPLQPIVL
jgi:large subunit ribosomal protein L13